MFKQKLRVMKNEDDASEPSTSNNVECSRKVTDDNDRNYNRVQPGHSTPEQKESTDLDLVSLNQDHEDALDRKTSMIREGWLRSSYDVDEEDFMDVQKKCQVPQGALASTVTTIPVDKTSQYYNMSHPTRGICLVLNHNEYDGRSSKREGTQFDVQRIQTTFTKLRFDVDVRHDLTYGEVLNVIGELSDPKQPKHLNSDCLCIFVLTHGMENDFLLAKDAAYISDILWKPFTADKCPTLAGKPKLFFIQACRGTTFDKAVTMEACPSNIETDSPIASYTIPAHSDFLIAHSCPDGFYSIRNKDKGSWYIQCLCDVLDSCAETTDLMKMLTMTARRVATDCTWYHKEESQKVMRKQVSSIMSTLTRGVHFSTT